MVDLRLEDDGRGSGDIVLEGGDLALDRGLRTPVLVSLYCDRRAEPDDPEALDGTVRGFVGDEPGDRIGSRLWQLQGETLSAAALNRRRDLVLEALSWLIEEGIVERVEVDVARVASRQDAVRTEVRLYRGTARLWPELWESTLETDQLEAASPDLLLIQLYR